MTYAKITRTIINFDVLYHSTVDSGGLVIMFFILTLYRDHVIGVLVSGQYLAPDLLTNEDFYLSEQGVSYLNNLLNYCRIALNPTVLTKPPGSTGVYHGA
jgi:hypothetical protein